MKLYALGAGDLVSQDEMEAVISLDSQIARLVAARAGSAERILRRLNSGAQIEPGTRHVTLEDSYRGPVRRQKLVIK